MDDILILTHIRPDGDTVGCGCALSYALRKIGKTAYLYNNPQFPDAYPWVSDPYVEPEGFAPKHIVAVDLADVGMFPKGFEGHVELCIDHHPSNSMYADDTLLMAEKASCGEIVLEVAKALMGTLDATIADLLYVAVSTDCGCFAYGSTTGETLQAGAELCFAGANNKYLNKVLFRTSSRARIALEGMIFSDLRYYSEGKTVFAIVTKEMMAKAGATEQDCHDLANLPGRVEGALCSALLKESDDGNVKISLRSTGIINANEICGLFGGGGHAMASGCCMKDKTCQEAADILAAAIDKAY